MRLFLAVLVAALAAWLGVAYPAAAIAVPTQPLPSYTYDGHVYHQPTDFTAPERGPPVSSVSRIPTYHAIDRWSRGLVMRPSEVWDVLVRGGAN